MNELTAPWLNLSIIVPGVGWLAISLLKILRGETEKLSGYLAILFSAAATLCGVLAWVEITALQVPRMGDPAGVWLLGTSYFRWEIDPLTAPLLPLTAGIYTGIQWATPLSHWRQSPWRFRLISQSLASALLLSNNLSLTLSLAILQIIPIAGELLWRGRGWRVFLVHQGTAAILLLVGSWLCYPNLGAPVAHPPTIGLVCLVLAILIRNGCAPLHCWLTDLYENLSWGSAIGFTTTMPAAILAIRLMPALATAMVWQIVVWASLFTAAYAAAMSLVQRAPRRFFAYSLLSNMSLVFVGLEVSSVIGLTGALCSWLSVGLSLTAYGLTMRAIEARVGMISLQQYHGLYSQIPYFATLYLVGGLASIGFPGTSGFVGLELLVEGAGQVHPVIGASLVLIAGINSVAVFHSYFRCFTGCERRSAIPLPAAFSEKVVIWTLTLLLVGIGIWPQPEVSARFAAASQLIAGDIAGDEQAPGADTSGGHHLVSQLLPEETKSLKANSDGERQVLIELAPQQTWWQWNWR